MASRERSERSPASPVMAGGGNLADWICLLLLLSVGVQGQADDSGDGDGGSGDGGPAAAAGDDEAWQYVEFLKTEVNQKLENILQVTFYEARDKKSLTVLEETVSQTLKQVMEIRESLLNRIKDIRKEVIKTDETQNVKQEAMLSDLRMEIMTILLKLVDKDAANIDKLKEISKDLLNFKMSVSSEIMRILMLPQSTSNPTPDPPNLEDCPCGVLTNISEKIDNLLKCAEGGAKDGAKDADEDTEEASGDCPPPEMYAMELITINEEIDTDIKNIYNSLVSTVEDDVRKKLFKDLNDKKSIREGIDELITKLMTQTDKEKLTKSLSRDLGRIDRQLKPILAACMLQCDGGSDGCGCGSEILQESIDKMEGYKIAFENIEDDEAKKEFVRSDLIKYINDVNNERRDILIKKATDQESFTDCDKQKLDVYKTTKAPMWMLVNTTIFADMSELEVMIDTMISELKSQLAESCSATGPADPSPELPEARNCEWEEYTETKDYLVKVDDVIQDALFKGNDESARMTALIGFVDIQSMFDGRVKKLFEEKLECPGEVQVIKKDYMGQLNKCMAEFMNQKLKFSDLTRLQRISCTKVLRNTMESRMSELLKSELEKSLNDIDTGEDSTPPTTTNNK